MTPPSNYFYMEECLELILDRHYLFGYNICGSYVLEGVATVKGTLTKETYLKVNELLFIH